MSLRGMLVLLGAMTILVVGLLVAALSGECGGGAGCVATAGVDGRTYVTSVARTMDIQPGDLVRYMAVARYDGGLNVIDEDAYRLGDLDPTKVLVMRLVAGQRDDAGPLGNYLLLVSGAEAWALTCPYFPPDDTLRPEVCT